jgi:hypothetical protein
MRPRTTLLGVTFASSLHSFGMQTSEFRPRGAGALGGIKGRLGLSLEVGHDVAGDQLEALGGRLRVRPIVATRFLKDRPTAAIAAADFCNTICHEGTFLLIS